MDNTIILDAIIKYLTETKRFDAQLFLIISGCRDFNIDIAATLYISSLFLFLSSLSFYYFKVFFTLLVYFSFVFHFSFRFFSPIAIS